MAKKKDKPPVEPVPTGTDMQREMAAATLAAETEITHAAADERNTVITHLNPVVDEDTGEVIDADTTITTEAQASEERSGKADITSLAQVLDHSFGRNVSGRFVYSLNFVAQRLARELLKNEIADQAKDPAERAAEQEINDYFGFGGAAQDDYGIDVPQVTLADALHWQTLTWMYVMDLSQYTEADERGMKSKPFAWMAQLVKNPITMVYSDARFGHKQQVSQQVVNAAKLGLTGELLEQAQAKYDEETKVVTEQRTHEKLDMLRGFMRDKHTYKDLSTEDLDEAITNMVVALGINVPKFLADLAADYKFKATERALNGKFIGEIDEDMLSFVPDHKMTWVGGSHEERLAAARAKYEAAHRVIDSGIEADKATKTPEAQAEIKRNLRRVDREAAAQYTAMGQALANAGHAKAH